MRKHLPSVLILLIGFGLAPLYSEGPAASGKIVRSIDDVLHNAKRRDIVFVAGTVKQSFDLYNVLLVEGRSEIAVSLADVPQDVRPGDKIAVVGWFDGRLSYRSSYGLIIATDWAPQNSPKFVELRNKYGIVFSTPVPSPAPVAVSVAASSASISTIELRLRELEDLKTKDLVTPDEYKQQRKRILDQL